MLISCREPELVVVPNNDAPDYSAVPQIVVENYVNRIFIDLLGREPLALEKQVALQSLLTAELADSVREDIIHTLQSDSLRQIDQSNYRATYYSRLYEIGKGRLLEGVTDELIAFRITKMEEKIYLDSVRNDPGGVSYAEEERARLQALLDAREEYQQGAIDHRAVYGRMLQNWIYDDINMGSFNFINAAFEDLFFRFPSEAEYDASFEVIEYNQPGIVFGEACSNKEEWVNVMVESREFAEGTIRWAYRTLLSREATSREVADEMVLFYVDHDFCRLQRKLMKSDEYALF